MARGSSELLTEFLRDWGTIYGRKLDEGAMAVWTNLFISTDSRLLSIALQEVTKNCERMPTPGHVTAAIKQAREKNLFASPPGIAARGFQKAVGKDPESGKMVNCLIDPETGELMYRASDCPEGREFLRVFYQLASRDEGTRLRIEKRLAFLREQAKQIEGQS